MTVSWRRGLVIATIEQSQYANRLQTGGRNIFQISPELTIQSALLCQKPHLPFGVAPNKAKHDSFFLSTLESVDASKFNANERLPERLR